jgi:arylsulfatase A-like enzyme
VWTNDVPFRDGVACLPARMVALGYRTACFGKLHHYPVADAKGFQHVRQMEEGRLGADEPYCKWLAERGETTDLWHLDDEDLTFELDDELHYEHWIASEAIDYVENLPAEPDGPFFMWVSFQGPHEPLNPPRGVKGTVDADALPRPLSRPECPPCAVLRYREAWFPVPADVAVVMRERVAYAECIVNIDRQIGRILEALKQRGVLDTTTIVFSSDHGDLRGDFRLKEKGPFPYSGQLNVPLILANHPGAAAGTRSPVLTGNLDIPATVLDVAGGSDGIGLSRSLLDLLRPGSPRLREVNFSEYGDAVKIVETQRYRFAYYPFIGFCELFDRIADPCEERNMAGEPGYRDVECEMLKRVADFGILCKGVETPGFDLAPDVQARLRKLHPAFDRPGEFKAAFPLNTRFKQSLQEKGLDPNYTNWYRHHRVLADYGKDYSEM